MGVSEIEGQEARFWFFLVLIVDTRLIFNLISFSFMLFSPLFFNLVCILNKTIRYVHFRGSL